MDTLKLRKDISKPGLLRVVRKVFDPVVDPVSGLARVPCAVRLDPISPVQYRRAFQQVLQRTQPARQGSASDVGVARSLSGSRGRHRGLFLPAGPRSVLSATPASQRLDHVLPSSNFQ